MNHWTDHRKTQVDRQSRVIGELAAALVDAIPRSHRSDLLEFHGCADVLDMRPVGDRTGFHEINFGETAHAGPSQAIGDRLPCSLGAVRPAAAATCLVEVAGHDDRDVRVPFTDPVPLPSLPLDLGCMDLPRSGRATVIVGRLQVVGDDRAVDDQRPHRRHNRGRNRAATVRCRIVQWADRPPRPDRGPALVRVRPAIRVGRREHRVEAVARYPVDERLGQHPDVRIDERHPLLLERCPAPRSRRAPLQVPGRYPERLVVTLVRHLVRVANRVPEGCVHVVRSRHAPDSGCSVAVVIRPNSALRPPDERRRICPEQGICAQNLVELGGIEPPSISR